MADRPFTIVAYIDGPGLGDVMACSTNAAIVKRSVPGALLIACVVPRAELYAEALLLNPDIDYVAMADDEVAVSDLMDAHYAPAGYMPDWVRQAFMKPNLVLIPNMLDFVMPVAEGAVLRVPDWYETEARETLVGLGLDPENWFACLHVREDGYRRERTHPRSVRDIAPYATLIDHIIDELGGQVVRIGDPTMSPIPPRAGMVDLGRRGTSYLTQCFALGAARFMVGTDSGPSSWCFMFNTPLAFTNKFTEVIFAPSIHVCATKTFVLPDGTRLSGRAAAESGHMVEAKWPGSGIELIETAAADMIKAVDWLHVQTEDSEPWAAKNQMPVRERDLSAVAMGKTPHPFAAATFLEDVS